MVVVELPEREAKAVVIAAAMATALDEASAWPARDGCARFDPHAIDAVCFVPATSAAFARRGFDHMELVSRALCREEGLELADVLVRPHSLDQRSLGREERAANLAGTISVRDRFEGDQGTWPVQKMVDLLADAVV